MTDFDSPIDKVFVYGTLKRGQCRESCWPVEPIEILPAWVRGTLWGRDDYPALTAGSTRVCGELWILSPDSVGQVLTVLDGIEGTCGNSQADLYHRHVVDVVTERSPTPQRGFTYFYNRDPVADGFVKVPERKGVQVWPG